MDETQWRRDLLVGEGLLLLVIVVLAVELRRLSFEVEGSSLDVGEEILRRRSEGRIRERFDPKRERRAHVEARLERLRLLHGRLLKVHLGVPGLKHEAESELTGSMFLESLLPRSSDDENKSARAKRVEKGMGSQTSMVMKFLSDLDILRPSM